LQLRARKSLLLLLLLPRSINSNTCCRCLAKEACWPSSLAGRSGQTACLAGGG